jgi:predicted Zn finger-like uncharacterized protein
MEIRLGQADPFDQLEHFTQSDETMIVECTACSTMFPVDPKKIPSGGVHARCSVCNEVFFVSEPESELDFADREVARPPEEGAFDHAEATPEDAGDDFVERPGDDLVGEPGDDLVEEPGDDLVEEPGDDLVEEPGYQLVEEAGDDFIEEAGDDLGGEPEGYFEGGMEPTFGQMETTFGEMKTDFGGMGADLQEAGPTEDGTEPLYGETPGGFGVEPGADTAEMAEQVEEAPAPAAPVFGKRDPTEKAQRLARVLVSDIILYNPDRHHMATESGRVKEEFEEEIQKSWNEYVEQVGENMANSTNFFNDALNEILARGKQIF